MIPLYDAKNNNFISGQTLSENYAADLRKSISRRWLHIFTGQLYILYIYNANIQLIMDTQAMYTRPEYIEYMYRPDRNG